MDYTMEEKRAGRKRAARVPTVVELLGFVPGAWQARVLESGAGKGILNCARQCGKSTVTAVMSVVQAYTAADGVTLVVSPSARQCGEFLRKAAQFARKLAISRKGDGDNEVSLLFPNGSRIVGLPGNEETIRRFSAVSLLLVDEASRVPDDVYLAARPMLAVSGGALWLMSTPCGKRGFFWETWDGGEPEWEKVGVTAYDCKRIRREVLEKDRQAMGERRFRQEYLCEFGEAEDGVFNMDVVRRALTIKVEKLKI